MATYLMLKQHGAYSTCSYWFLFWILLPTLPLPWLAPATHCNLRNSFSLALLRLLWVEESHHTDHDKKESRQHSWNPKTWIYPHHRFKENQQHHWNPKTRVYPHRHLTPFCFLHVVTSCAEFNWLMRAITMLLKERAFWTSTLNPKPRGWMNNI
jgi:hypothetical protein